MKIKLLKLINNERINKKLVSVKACGPDTTSEDYCPVDKDFAICSVYAYDQCTKEDHAGCTEGADDICHYDYAACAGAGKDDICGFRDLDAN